MKIVMLMFDTLNRHMLPSYGCEWTHAPNFRRLAEQTVTFDRSYVCSMPCMPARRDLQTGRPNFLHRSWGPLEPFDDSVFDILRQHGVYSHLTTDHYHYFEDGGLTYHSRYDTWQFSRGQEGDPWIGQVADPAIPEAVGDRGGRRWRQDWINRPFMRHEHQQPQARTFRDGLDFIRRNHGQDQWVLQLETFDPHEPFFSPRKYKDLYAEHFDRYRKAGGKHFDWPLYREVQETPEQVEHCRYEYAALLSMCDAHLGDVLDLMDEMAMWDDTMLIVWTDHGFFLGERDLWAKVWMPLYEEIAHTPFFIWDPRCGRRGERRQSLVQPAIDLPVTLLGAFGIAPTPNMLGRDLAVAVVADTPVREAALFGIHGGHVNVTDGRYVYMRGPASPENRPLYEYTLMPTHMTRMFSPGELQNIQLAEPFSFTKGCRTMRIAAAPPPGWNRDKRTMLFDLERDPQQQRTIDDPALERRMLHHLARLMRECDAPAEQYERLAMTNTNH